MSKKKLISIRNTKYNFLEMAKLVETKFEKELLENMTPYAGDIFLSCLKIVNHELVNKDDKIKPEVFLEFMSFLKERMLNKYLIGNTVSKSEENGMTVFNIELVDTSPVYQIFKRYKDMLNYELDYDFKDILVCFTLVIFDILGEEHGYDEEFFTMINDTSVATRGRETEAGVIGNINKQFFLSLVPCDDFEDKEDSDELTVTPGELIHYSKIGDLDDCISVIEKSMDDDKHSFYRHRYEGIYDWLTFMLEYLSHEDLGDDMFELHIHDTLAFTINPYNPWEEDKMIYPIILIRDNLSTIPIN